MKLPIQLTDHARSRLEERTSLAESAFVALLANHQTVSVGYRRSSGHWHRLFFSEPDRMHFVAIQDITNGDIITVLPLDYHENIAWKIEDAQKRSAVWKAAPDVHSELFLPKFIPVPGAKMEVTGIFGTNGRKVNLGAHRFSVVPTTASDALSDDAFVAKIFEKIAQRDADLLLLEEILLYDKKSSAFLKLPWHSIEQFSLDFDLPKRPNQTPEPTPLAVTDRAFARSAPSTRVAHL